MYKNLNIDRLWCELWQKLDMPGAWYTMYEPSDIWGYVTMQDAFCGVGILSWYFYLFWGP